MSALLIALTLAGGKASDGQSSGSTASDRRGPNITLADVVRNLPEYGTPDKFQAEEQAIQKATDPERDAAVPGVIGWLGDERPVVRGSALLMISSLYMPTGQSRVTTCSRYLPVEDVTVVAAHLRDPDSRVRNATFYALSSVETCGHGLDKLDDLVLPMLREPDILTEYPDPFFVESDRRMLESMTPQQQKDFLALDRTPPKLPAEGPLLLSILAIPIRMPSVRVDDAIISFLDRADQTVSTLGECLHTLAVSYATERVNDEALRRVFEVKGMTVYLLQFVSRLRLTPTQVAIQKERLVALSNDREERASLRRAAATVAACWGGERSRQCQPTSEELDDSNARPSKE